MNSATPSAENRLLSLDLDAELKSTLIQLCRDLGLSHSGLKAQLQARLHAAKARVISARESAGAAATSSAGPLPTASPADGNTDSRSVAVAMPSSSVAACLPVAQPPSLGPPLPSSFAAWSAPSVLPQPFPPPVTHVAPPTHLPSTTVPPAVTSLSLPTLGHPQQLDIRQIALQAAQQAAQLAAQQAAQQAVSQVLACAPGPSGLTTAPHTSSTAVVSQFLPTPSTLYPTLPGGGTTPTWIYQPPSIFPMTSPQLASYATLTQPFPQPSLAGQPPLAPFGAAIPVIPKRFAAAAAAGEYVDFGELLHVVDVEGGEEVPLFVQVGEGHQLSLPRKPRKKMLASFSHWVRCFCIYGNSLTASQPSRGPDLLGYLYLMASMEQEFTFPACLSYDIAFRRKAHKFHLATWGHIDTQLYARAFTGPGKAKPQACCDLCLASTHSTTQCHFYSGGPVKKARASTSGPKIPTTPPSSTTEVCLNYNRGKCTRTDCRRRHVCLIPQCGGQHQAMHCPGRRSSPRKT